jgi:hypothetical protein
MATRNLIDCLQQVTGGLILQNVALHTCLERLGNVLTFVMLREQYMVFVLGNERSISRAAFNPLKVGIEMSITTISGRNDSTWRRASCPSEASPTT